MRMVAFVALIGLMAVGCLAAEPAPAGKAEAATTNAAAAQPTTIPGKWKLVEDPLPPFDEIAKRPAAMLPVYGLYGWCGEYEAYRQDIKKVGWKSIRIGGPMDEKVFKMMCEDGVEIMKTVGLRDVNPTGEAKNRAGYKDDETFIADYIQGLERFMTRFGPGGTFFKDNPDVPNKPILYVEIWNEPNFQYMIPDREPRAEVEKEREALYAKVLPAAYQAIKAKWPTVTVVGFGAGGAAKGDIRFIKNVLAQGDAPAKSFDVLSTHPYQPPTPPEAHSVRTWGTYSVASSLKEIRDILAAKGRGDARIWYTEVGWPISKADGGNFEDKGKEEMVSPTLQAAYVVRQYALSMRLGVERCHIMFTSDSDGFNGGFFTRGDKKWRPSATAVQTMIKLMPNPRLVKALSDGQDGYYVYEFAADALSVRKPREMVTMAWNVAGSKKVEIPVATASARVTDMLGTDVEVKAEGGKISIEVGPRPVYISPLGLE
jgi:hypothetical protein